MLNSANADLEKGKSNIIICGSITQIYGPTSRSLSDPDLPGPETFPPEYPGKSGSCSSVYEVTVRESELGTTKVECIASNVWGTDKKTTKVVSLFSLSCYKCVTKVCASSLADISIAHIVAGTNIHNH
eukprot:sb/3475425/